MPIPPIIRDLFQRLETVTLVFFCLIGAAAWAFVGLASEMAEGDLHAFDETVLLALRQPGDLANPIGGRALETAMRDLTALGGVTVLTLITVLILVYLFLRGQRATALLLSIAILGGQALSHMMKSVFSRPRPDLVPHGVEVATASFPSGHSMMAAVTYLTLAVILARTQPQLRIRVFLIAAASFLAILVGVSRVFLGVHWPSDVLAGWSLGAAWALGVSLVARMLAQRGQIEPNSRHDT